MTQSRLRRCVRGCQIFRCLRRCFCWAPHKHGPLLYRTSASALPDCFSKPTSSLKSEPSDSRYPRHRFADHSRYYSAIPHSDQETNQFHATVQHHPTTDDRNVRGDDLTRLQIDNLHPPKVGHIVYCITARAIHCIRSKDSRIRSYAGHSVATRIYQIEVVAASIGSLRLLENRAG